MHLFPSFHRRPLPPFLLLFALPPCAPSRRRKRWPRRHSRRAQPAAAAGDLDRRPRARPRPVAAATAARETAAAPGGARPWLCCGRSTARRPTAAASRTRGTAAVHGVAAMAACRLAATAPCLSSERWIPPSFPHMAADRATAPDLGIERQGLAADIDGGRARGIQRLLRGEDLEQLGGETRELRATVRARVHAGPHERGRGLELGMVRSLRWRRRQ
ncbi:hypothetical protein ACP4OV_016358 [Aristida adscensionis]